MSCQVITEETYKTNTTFGTTSSVVTLFILMITTIRSYKFCIKGSSKQGTPISRFHRKEDRVKFRECPGSLKQADIVATKDTTSTDAKESIGTRINISHTISNESQAPRKLVDMRWIYREFI